MRRLLPASALMLALLAAFGAVLWPVLPKLGKTTSAPSEVLQPASATDGDTALLPLPPTPALPPEKVELGKRLFFDVRLSHDDSIACASCHDFARGGADRLPKAVGIRGQIGPVNTPTVFNAALHFTQFWDGRAASLEEQAAGPIHNPLEMDSNWEEVIAKLERDVTYQSLFRAIYPRRGLTPETIVDALAAYERTLLTPSRFDRFLKGDANALDEKEKAGYQTFLRLGCSACHQGAAIGGNLFQRFGLYEEFFAGRPITPADLGRFNVTHREEDRFVFKVPSLRNVAVTAPYFHDGSVATLEEAIAVMARYQLGRKLTQREIDDVAAFLRSLTGEWEGNTLK